MNLNTQAKKRLKRFFSVIFLTYFSIVIYLTLLTYNHYAYGDRSFNLEFFNSIQLMLDSRDPVLIVKNILGNVFLFLPFGFLIPLILRPIRPFISCLFLSILTSGLIELSQFEFAKRVFDVDDIFLNVIGAMIGWLIFKIVYSITRFIISWIKKNAK